MFNLKQILNASKLRWSFPYVETSGWCDNGRCLCRVSIIPDGIAVTKMSDDGERVITARFTGVSEAEAVSCVDSFCLC